MTWYWWCALVLATGLGALVLHAWLWWRLWRTSRGLLDELSTVTTQVAELSAELVELGLAPDRVETPFPGHR